jgi:hypothetical protein
MMSLVAIRYRNKNIVSPDMPKATPSQVARAKSKRTLVRFESPFGHSSVRGYVLDTGPQFFLVAVVSDRIRFDGFECFRVGDVGDLRPDPHRAFVESALQIRGEQIPVKARVSLASIEELLLSASREAPLVVVHCEEMDPGVCWIGRILSIKRGRLSLLGISPEAQWHEEPDIFRLDQVTRVSFGGDYEAALYLVGGEPPEAIKSRVATGDDGPLERGGQNI